METKRILKSTLSYKFLTLFQNNESKELKDLLIEIQKLITKKSFDSINQNILIVEHLFTRNMYDYLIQRQDQDILISDLLQTIEKNKDPFTVLQSLYILSNYIYLKNINPTSPSFSEESLKYFQVNLQEYCFVNLKYNNQPSFPLMKIFLSQINHNFNNFEQYQFIKNINNIHKLQIIIKNIDRNKDCIIKQNSKKVSLFYGAFFDKISLMEQNNYDQDELDLIHSLLQLLSQIFFQDKSNFNIKIIQLIDKITSFINKLKKQKSIFLPFVQDKLIEHLKVICLFFKIYKDIFYSNDSKSAIKKLFDKEVYNFEKKKFNNLYSLSFQNLLAIINIKNKNYQVANSIFQKALTRIEFQKPYKEDDFENKKNLLQLDLTNNQMQINPIHMNFAIFNYNRGNYFECIQILTSLQFHFQQNYFFWYKLGQCYYKIFKKQLEGIQKILDSDFKKNLSKDQQKYKFSRYQYYYSHNLSALEFFFKQKEINKGKKILCYYDEAMKSFFNCYQLINIMESKNSIKKNFKTLKKKKIDNILLSYSIFIKNSDQYYLSSLQMLIYLNIMYKNYKKAHFYIKIIKRIHDINGNNLLKSNKQIYLKVLMYSQIIFSKLRLKEEANRIKTDLNDFDHKLMNKKANFKYFQGKENNFNIKYEQAISYNNQIQQYLLKPNKLIQHYQNNKKGEEIFDLEDFSKLNSYEKKFKWAIYQTHCHSKYHLNSLLINNTESTII